MTELMHRAKIVVRKGVEEWRCQNCDQKLGEIIGQRVKIRISGRDISFPVLPGVDQTCPVCGVHSVLECQHGRSSI